MALEEQFWSQDKTFSHNADMKESSPKTAWIETSEVLCFGLLPLLLKSGTSPIVLDFNSQNNFNPFLKTSYPLFSVHGYIQKILVLERIVAFFKSRRWPLWFVHISPVLLGSAWVSSWHSKMLQIAHWYFLILSPTAVKCKEWRVTERQTQNCLQQLHCLQVWGDVQCVMEDGLFLCAVSLLLSDMEHCSQHCESFSGKVSHVVLVFVLMALFPRTKLLFAPPHTVCWVQHPALGHCLIDRFSFF